MSAVFEEYKKTCNHVSSWVSELPDLSTHTNQIPETKPSSWTHSWQSAEKTGGFGGFRLCAKKYLAICFRLKLPGTLEFDIGVLVELQKGLWLPLTLYQWY